MKTKAAFGLMSFALLTACMSNTPQPVAAIPFQPAATLDQSRIIGTETVEIKAYAAQNTVGVNLNKEAEGATCTASSAEGSVSFTTPGKVSLPVFKGQPSPLTIKCSFDGKTGSITRAPELIESNASGNSVFEQSNIVAGLVVGAVRAAQERAEARSRDAWRYVNQSAGVQLK